MAVEAVAFSIRPVEINDPMRNIVSDLNGPLFSLPFDRRDNLHITLSELYCQRSTMFPAAQGGRAPKLRKKVVFFFILKIKITH